jgi:uncharacterized protein (DUF885 family)
MTKLAQSQGYKDLASFREAVNNDPKWKPTSEQEILDDYKKYIHQNCPALPGCWSQGETEQEAMQNIRDAIEDYLAAVNESVRGSDVREVEVSV